MNFFQLGYNRILSATADCMHGVYVYGGMTAFIALIVSLIIVRILLKKKLLKRTSSFQSIISGSYGILIPVLFVFYGFLASGTYKCKSYSIGQLENNITPMIKLVFPSYQYFLVMNWGKIIENEITFGETVNSFSKKANIEPYGSGMEERFNVFLANHFLPRVVSFGVEAIIFNSRKQEKISGSDTKNPLVLARTVNTFNYPPHFWSDVNQTIVNKLNTYFNSFLIIISVIFFSILLLITLEIRLAKKYKW